MAGEGPARREVRLDGMSMGDVLSLSDEDVAVRVACGEFVAFRARDAEILGAFRVENGTLVVELTGIAGGGEGLLPLVAGLAHRFAARERPRRVEWRVRRGEGRDSSAEERRVLERRGFERRTIAGTGACYYLLEMVDPDGHVRRPRALIGAQDYVIDVVGGAAVEATVVLVRHPATGKSVSRVIGAEPVERHLPELLLELERALRPGPHPS